MKDSKVIVFIEREKLENKNGVQKNLVLNMRLRELFAIYKQYVILIQEIITMKEKRIGSGEAQNNVNKIRNRRMQHWT